MRFIILSALIAYLEYAGAQVTDEACDGIVINNVIHEQQVLKEIHAAYQLTIDYNTNTLFFSYSDDKSGSAYDSAYINLNTNESKIIKGINGGFASAVDEIQKVVYLGGKDGIYRFDYATKVATHIDGTNHNIWQMFFKKYLHYTTYPEEEVYIFKELQSSRVPELNSTKGLLIAVDNYDNIYFWNSTGLFVHNNADDQVTFVGDYDVNGFTSDSKGKVFFSTGDGLYYINDDTKKVETLALIGNGEVFGMAVEADGSIIYASLNSLIRLKPTNVNCYNNDNKNL